MIYEHIAMYSSALLIAVLVLLSSTKEPKQQSGEGRRKRALEAAQKVLNNVRP